MDTLLDIKQLAAVLNLSVGATYRRHQRGQLCAPVRIGRSLRWRFQDVAKLLGFTKLDMTDPTQTQMIGGRSWTSRPTFTGRTKVDGEFENVAPQLIGRTEFEPKEPSK